MFIILVYDVERIRLHKALKICRKYLVHVQKSVFEGRLTPLQYKCLKQELALCLSPKKDSVIIYQMESLKFTKKEEFGKTEYHHFIM